MGQQTQGSCEAGPQSFVLQWLIPSETGISSEETRLLRVVSYLLDEDIVAASSAD